MSRRMYSESQLNKMIDSKLEGYDASIPTDLTAHDEAGVSIVQLVHDGNAIGEGIPLKQIFGNNTLVGNGNIDLYNHHIGLQGAQNAVCFFTVVSSKNIIADSAQDLDTLIGTVGKTIPANGYLHKADGTDVNIIAFQWMGTFAKSRFLVSDRTYITVADSGLVRIGDVLETI